MSRKAEFYALIEPLLKGQKEVKQDTIELAQDLQDVLNNINIDVNGESFSDLKEAFNEKLSELGKQPIVFSENTLKGVIDQFANAVSEGIKAGVAEGSSAIKSMLKDKAALEEAYNERQANGRGSKTKVKQKLGERANEAIHYLPSETAKTAGQRLRSIQTEYNKATGWENQYIALLKYVKEYEAFEKLTKKPQELDKWKEIGGYHIDQLKQQIPAIQHSLQNIFNLAHNISLVGLTSDGAIDINVQLNLLDTIDTYDVTGGKGHIEVEVKPKIKEFAAYRVVEETEEGAEKKQEVIDVVGAEYWAKEKSIARSYSSQHDPDGNSYMLKGKIRPVNPLVLDVFGAAWDEFDQMPNLSKIFPGLSDFIKSISDKKGKFDAVDVQRYLAEQAKNAGFDAIILENVRDAANEAQLGDKDYFEGTTIAVLDDSIVKLEKAFKSTGETIDEFETKEFSTKGEKIPEFYQGPAELTHGQRLTALQQQQAQSDAWYTSEIARLKENEIANSDTIEILEGLRASAQKNFEKEIDYYTRLSAGETPQVARKNESDNERAAKEQRRKELVDKLDEYGADVLNSQTAYDNLVKRKEIFELLQKEDLLTDEIKKNYDEVNQRLEARADLIREAEWYYDDVNDVIGSGTRVDAIDSEEQYRRDHLDKFDAVVDKMRTSGVFSEEELENSFYQVLDTMESYAQDIGIESAFDELDIRVVNPEDVTDINELNRLLQERQNIIENAGEWYLEQYDSGAYEEAINLNDAIADRIALLQQNDEEDDDIRRENGALEEKLELLREIAEEYGSDITQKQRDRYDELNQKEADSGLTSKEEDRQSELGDKIYEADEALIHFEETYDRIILKLANGKKVEILPEDKGLRSLYKYAEESLGDDFNGIEIEDVVFERVKKEEMAHKSNTSAIQAETQAQEDLNKAKQQSLLPNADNFNQNSFMDEAQKAEVLKLGEEYRTIMTLLERDDAELSEIADALRERATAIMNVMHTVTGNDSTAAESYKMYYGGSTEIVESIANFAQRTRLHITSFDDDKIDNTARQAAIDLIYKEIEAQKQLAEARKAATEAERQQEIDNFVSKYESATTEEKKLVNDLTGLWQESVRLNELEDDESMHAYNQVIFDRYTVSEKLKAANRELYEAFYDVNPKEVAKHIKPIDTGNIGGASSAEVDNLRQQLEEANRRAEEAETRARDERNKRTIAEESFSDLHDDLYDAQKQARASEEEAARLRDELAKKSSGTSGGTGDADTGTEASRMTGLKEAVEAVTEAVGLKTSAFQTEKTEVDKVVNAEIESLGKLEKKINGIKEIFEGLVNNIRGGSDDIAAGLSNVNINVNYPENNQPTLDEGALNKLADILKSAQVKTPETALDVAGKALATEGTLSAIKTAVESINNKTVKGAKVGSDSEHKTTTKDDYIGSKFFGEKLETRKSEVAKFAQQLINKGRNTPKAQEDLSRLLTELLKVGSGEQLSVWDQHFRQAKLAVGIDELKEKPDEQESVQTYKNLIAYAKEYYSIVEKYEKAKEGTRRKAILAQQKQDAETFMRDGGLDLDALELGDEAYNKKLSDLRTKHKRNLEVIRADNQDKTNAQDIREEAKATSDAKKQEASIVNKLIGLYTELGKAKARQNVDLFDEDQIAKAYADEARIRRQIQEQRSSLSSIDKDTGLQFKHAKDEAYAAATTDAKLVADSKARKQQVKDESNAINALLGLYKKYGALDAKWNYANGQKEAVEQERQMIDVYKQIQEQKASMGLSENSTKYDDQIAKAWEQGFKEIENAKREARAKASDRDEAKRIQDEVKNVEKYVKELGALEAELQFVSGAKEITEINRQIEQKKRYIDLKKQELQIDERSLLIQQTKSYQDKYNSLSLKDRRAKDKADDAAIIKRNNEAYERLIKLRREQYDIEKKLYAVKKGSKLEATYKSQLADIGHLIANQKTLVHYNAKYERQLTEMANVHQRNKAQWESGQIDDARADALAAEKKEVDKLTDAYKQLGKWIAERNYATLPEEKDAIQAIINKHVKDINANQYNTADRFDMLRGVARASQAQAEEGLSRKAAKKTGADRLRSEAKAENEDLTKQKQIISNLISLYKQLGQAKARQNKGLFSEEQVAQAYIEDAQLRRLIKSERAKLSSVDLDTDMRFKGAKAEGYRLATTNAERAAAGKATSQRMREETKAENEALREQKQVVKELIDLYRQLGQAEAKRDMTSQNIAQAAMADDEYDAIQKEIDAKRQLVKIDDKLENQFTESWMSGIETETKKPIGNLTKAMQELGELRAKIEQTPNSDYLGFLKRQFALKSKLLAVESDRLGISQDERESNRLIAQDAYDASMVKWQGELAKKRDKERADEQDKLFKKQIQQSKELAKISKAKSAIDKGDNLTASAMSVGGWSDEQMAKLSQYSAELKKLKDKYTEIKYSDGVVTEEQQREIIEQTAGVNKLSSEIGELIAQYNRLSGENVTELEVNTLSDNASLDEKKQKLTELAMAYSNGKAVIKKYDATTGELTAEINSGKYEVTEYTFALRQLGNQFVAVQGATKKLETPMEKLKRKMSEILTYFGGSSLIYEFFGQFRQGVQYVREIDLALTELKKVTDETEESYDRFLETASKTGARIGSTISDFTQATATFAKLGYDIDMASEMAEAAIVYKNVGDDIESADAAADSIISTMKGFGLEASDSMAIVDRFNEVGNRFAITSTEIGEALQRSASALNEGGNTIDESIGLITGGQTVVQNAEKVGTALKTLSLRLRGAKVDLEEAGLETDGMAESTSRLRDQLLGLTGGKVDIMLDENTFKSTTDILREMSEVWSSLTDIEAASALELMGGKQQANVLAAIIQNFDVVENAIKTSAESAGSAIKENERYLDSIQGRIDQFNNSVQTMWTNTLDDDLVKDIVVLGTEIIQLIDKIGLLQTALGALGLYKLIPWLLKGATGAQTFGAALKVLVFGADAASVSSYQLVTNLIKLFAEITKGIPAMVSFGYQAQGLSGAMSQLGKGIKMAWAAIPGVGKIMLIAAAIGAVVAIIEKVHVSLDEQAESLKNAQEEYEKSQQTLKNLNDELKTTKERIEELQGFDTLTVTEQDELKRLQKYNIELERRLKLEEKANAAAQKEQAEEAVKTYEKLPSTKAASKKQQDYFAMESVGYVAPENWKGFFDQNGKIEGADISYINAVYDYLQKVYEEYLASIEDDNLKLKYLRPGIGEEVLNDMSDAEKQEIINTEWDATEVQSAIDGLKDVLADIETEAFNLISNETTGYQSLLDSMAPQYERIIAKNEKLWSDSDKEIVDTYRTIESIIQSIWQKYDPAGWFDLSSKEIWSDERFDDIYDSLPTMSEDGAISEEDLRQKFDDAIVDALIAACEDKGILLTDLLNDSIAKAEQDGIELSIEDASITSSLSKISILEDAFNSLGDAMKEFKEDGTASADTLEGLHDVFKGVEGFDDLYKALATGEGDIAGAVTKVANAYIAQKKILSDVTDEELQIMAARLESLGVIDAQEVLQHRQAAQEKLNTSLEGYNIDLSAYVTAEQAKLAIATQAGLDFSQINDDNLNDLIEKYDIDVKTYKTAAEQKIQIAKKMALETAEANKASALSSLSQEYLAKGYTKSELSRSESYMNSKQAIFDEYNAAISLANSVDSTIDNISSILDDYYSHSFEFNLSGNYPGIGRDYDEEIDTKSKKDAEDALEKLRKKYENKISLLESQQTYLENEVSRMEAEDEQVGKAIYEEQIRLEEQKIGLYKKERDALLAAMNSVAKGSDEWYEYAEAVWETEHAIQDSTLAIVDFQQKITDLYVNVFDKIEESYGHLNDLRQYQQDYINNEMEYAELTDQPISADYYKELMKVQSKDYVDKLTEANALRQTLDLGLADGSIQEGTEEWADLQKRIYDANLEAQEARNTLEETNNEMKQLYVTAFEKVGEAYDALDSLYSDRRSYTEGYMELEELRGDPVQTGAYDYLIENETNSLNANLQKLADQEAKLQNAMANGIQKGSEEWIEMEAEIRATESAIQDNYIALEQYNEELKNLYSEAFNKVHDSFSDVTDVYDDQQAFVESYIDYLETLGVDVPAEMYEKLGNIELEKQEANIKKLADMQEAFAKMEAEGYTPEDEEWVQAKADIRAVEKAIWDSEVAMAEYNKRVREMDTEKFEEYTKRIGDMVDELERLYNLFSDEDVATEDGAWTEEGIASLGLMYQKMEIAKKQIADYQEEIDKLNDEYKSGAISEQEYNDRLVELKNSQWDSIEAYEDAKDAIVDINEARVDMIEEGINKEIEAYEELIDLKRKELDAERDLYNFRKDIQSQTKDIAALERKIAAMSGSTDAATIAERTKLEQQLRDAQDALDDSYYNHAMDSQSTALDDENEAYVTSKEDYVEMLRDALEDVEAIVTNTMSQVLINADTVLGELNGVSGEYGVTLSQSLISPWISAAQQAEAFKNSATMQEYEFAIQNGIFTGEITGDFEDLFSQTTGMAYQFDANMYTVMSTIQTTVYNATSQMTTDMLIPFEKALAYAQETFSPQTIEELNAVAEKAASLVYDETENLTSPWNDGVTAAHTYGDAAEEVLKKVYQKAQEYDPSDPIGEHLDLAKGKYDLFGTHVENVFTNMASDAEARAKEIGKDMSDIISDAQDAYNAITKVGTPPKSDNGGGGTKVLPKSSYQSEPPKNQHSNTAPPASDIKALQHCLNMLFSAGLTLDGKLGDKTKNAIKNAQKTMYNYGFESMKSQDGLYGASTRKAMINYIDSKIASLKQQSGSSMIGQAVQRYEGIKNRLPKAFYAKGTTGTKKDEWAMTDEIGDELVLIPGKGGNLQYMRKGTAVIPADISANLMEWGKLNPNMDMTGAVQGVNVMTNVINKPEINFEFENLLHIDNCTQDSVKDIEKIVTEQLDKFTRKLNYSLKQFK